MFLNQQGTIGVPVSGPTLQKTAMSISWQFSVDDHFTGKKRQLTVCGEKLFDDVSSIKRFE